MGEIALIAQSKALEICQAFALPGELESMVPYGSGHINDTFLATVSNNGQTTRYIHQRLNARVFPNLEQLMGNIERVTRYQHDRLRKRDPYYDRRRALNLISGPSNQPFYIDEEQRYWRTYDFIDGATTYDIIPSTEHAYAAAKAFGEFQGELAALPAPPLHVTIPDFHNTTSRLHKLRDAVSKDEFGRVSECKSEIGAVEDRAADIRRVSEQIANGTLPVRVVHNDTKLNNVMIDDETLEGICVIDLDTVMPGHVFYDFGDMVRTATITSLEDEEELGKVRCDPEMFRAITEGYLSGASSWLTEAETSTLVAAGRITTLEVAMRFLTDYLSGDVYFKTTRPKHNLIRCRTQLALVDSIEKQSERLHGIVKRCLVAT